MPTWTKHIVIEPVKGMSISGTIAFLLVWFLEVYVQGKGLQSYLQNELVTLVLTLTAVYTAIIGLALTQITNLRAMAMSDSALKNSVDSTLQSVSDALRISFVEMIVQVCIAVISASLSDSAILPYATWSYFALDVANTTVLVWAIWLLWDMGTSQFTIFGNLTDAVSKASKNVSVPTQVN